MLSSRDDIRAALSRSPGVGSHHLKLIARNALIRAGCEVGADPQRIATGLGKRIRVVPSADSRAELHGECIHYLWNPHEWRLNLYIGCALALLIDQPAKAQDICRLVGRLALLPTDDEASKQPYLPQWFITAYRRRSASDASLAIAR